MIIYDDSDESSPYFFNFITEKEIIEIESNAINSHEDCFYIAPEFEILIAKSLKYWEKNNDNSAWIKKELDTIEILQKHIGRMNMIIASKGGFVEKESSKNCILDLGRDVAAIRYNIRNCSINYFDKEYKKMQFNSLVDAYEFVKIKSKDEYLIHRWTSGFFEKEEGLTKKELSKPIDISKRKIVPCEFVSIGHPVTAIHNRQMNIISRIKNNEFNKENENG